MDFSGSEQVASTRLITHAWPQPGDAADEAAREAYREAAWAFVRQLPGLQSALKRASLKATPQPRNALNTAAEHAWVHAALPGHAFADGALPLAALASPNPSVPQAWLRFCHWDVAAEGARLLPVDSLSFSQQHIEQTLGQWVNLASEDGFSVLQKHPREPLCWRVAAPWLGDLAVASWQRVAQPGAHLDDWLGPLNTDAMKRLRRLQNEFQMLMYTEPLNDARIEAGLLPLNSFWLHGAGAVATRAQRKSVVHDDTLVGAALGSLRDWQAAWQRIDASLPAHLAQGQQVLIGGELGWLSLSQGQRGAWDGLKLAIFGNFTTPSMNLLRSLL